MKILAVRPGLLANFSGGAGYMPFVVIYSYPVAVIGNIIAAAIVHRAVNDACAGRSIAPPRGQADVAMVQAAAMSTMKWLLLPAGAAAVILYIVGANAIYGSSPMFFAAALLFAVAPLAAIPIGGWVVYRFTLREGPSKGHVYLGVAAGVAYLVALFAVLLLSTLML